MNAVEQERPIRRSLFGVLLRDTNWKCLILTGLIQGCLVAIVWCRNTQVTKILVDFDEFPISSTRQVSPCDDGYVYIPTAFVIMLYLLYLVECWHCKARVQLSLEKTDVNSVYRQVREMRETQPLVWWKAICYHYVRRFRQVTRYRNGEAYTSSQVFYERVNSNAVASCFFYAICGMKDISKELAELEKHPATRIKFAKSFVFSNTITATEFEEQRSMFFQEQRSLDDYMEMREGLELSSVPFKENVIAWSHPEALPWFAKNNVFWVFSFLLLSWPIRILLEMNTAHVRYTVTKLFGVNYPSNLNLHELQRPLSYSNYLHFSHEGRRGSRFPRRSGTRPNRLSNYRSYVSAAAATLLPQETAFHTQEEAAYDNFPPNGILLRASSSGANDDEEDDVRIEASPYPYPNQSMKIHDFQSMPAPHPSAANTPPNLPRSVTLMMEPEAFSVSFAKGLFTKRNYSYYFNSSITGGGRTEEEEEDADIPTYAEALLLMTPNSTTIQNGSSAGGGEVGGESIYPQVRQPNNTSICTRSDSGAGGSAAAAAANPPRESQSIMAPDPNETGGSLMALEIDMTRTIVSSVPADPLREGSASLNPESPPTYMEALRTSRPVFLPALTRLRRCLTERDIAGGVRSRDLERERLRSWFNYVSPTFLQRFRRRPTTTTTTTTATSTTSQTPHSNSFRQVGGGRNPNSPDGQPLNEKDCEESNI